MKAAAEKSLLKKSIVAIIFIVLILAGLQLFGNVSPTVIMIVAIVSAVVFCVYGLYKLNQIDRLKERELRIIK